jgi:Uma2 family endonuclease
MGLMSEVREKLISAEELGRMNVGFACELVRGRIVKLSPTGRPHSKVVSRVIHLLVSRASQMGHVMSGEAGFFVERNPDTVRAPDVAFMSLATEARADAAGGTFFGCAPDLAVEVLSPDDRWPTVDEKAREYLAAGAKAVWAADPATSTVRVYEPGRDPRTLGVSDEIDGGNAVPGFRAKVGDFFGP